VCADFDSCFATGKKGRKKNVQGGPTWNLCVKEYILSTAHDPKADSFHGILFLQLTHERGKLARERYYLQHCNTWFHQYQGNCTNHYYNLQFQHKSM
jgi:hypothetical protein